MSRNNAQNDLGIAIRFFIISTLVLGFVYPLSITVIGLEIFPELSKGSLIKDEKGEVKGSYLLAQKWETGIYFIPRPSAGDYSALPSLASQLAPSSLDLRRKVEERKLFLESKGIDWNRCQELLYESGSGVDPHITTDCARAQIVYIAKNRSLLAVDLELAIDRMKEKSIFGIMGRERVNVTSLNLFLGSL
ncbi:potassium-transporting ATPase subunit C [Leptospira ilyithenensis]|uniref:Potassium-transporting ATPase subunit C n=1 Tax=Leptospira ilyithenensis TaxID=2484901 RepID=A0A4R9LWB9_9LEPT|nr:potassium-transporting ATPase subunit C [Leptospira ilyithenensis]TGN13412.1 potassium-transporting ATPase subunit C [Leptospira ilyithenensis]